MKNKINIPESCNANWKSMSPNTNGRFCTSCHKTVVDFTKMESAEIQQYFDKNSAKESICGYYKLSQVDSENSDKFSKLRDKFNRIRVKPVKMVALFSLSFLFTFSSCIMGKRAEEQPEDTIENDSISQKDVQEKVPDTLQQNDTVSNNIPGIKKTK